MKNVGYVVFSLVLLFGAAEASCSDQGLGFEVTADYLGKYIWRGQNLVDDPVFQTALSANYKALTASIWGNLETTNINGNSGDFSELDYCLDYSSDVPGVTDLGYSIGFIYYDFPGTDVKDTTELYGGLNFDTVLHPAVTLYHDVDEADGSYVTVSVGHSIERIAELTPQIPIAMELSVGLGWGSGSYDKYYWGTDQSKLNDLVFSARFPIDVSGWQVTPSLTYVTLVSDDIRDTDAYGTDSDFFFVSIGISKRF
jgi:hypothetical protein